MLDKVEITSFDHASSALSWVIVPRGFRDFLIRQARHFGLEYPGEFAMALTLAPAGFTLSVDVEVVAARCRGIPQLSRPEGQSAKIQFVEFAAGRPMRDTSRGNNFQFMHILAGNFLP